MAVSYEILKKSLKKRSKDSQTITPMLEQYLNIKSQYKDAILFFRLGDFYEMFFEDAHIASKILEITLTTRDKNKENPIPMCGVPAHAAEPYITKLVKAGYKVAICEQVEDPTAAKGIVKREVIRILTPGLLTNQDALNAKDNNFLVSIFKHLKKDKWGISYIDLSTGEFKTTELTSEDELLGELFRLEPKELLVSPQLKNSDYIRKISQALEDIYITYGEKEWFSEEKAKDKLLKFFNTISLEGFGIENKQLSIVSSSALLDYVLKTQKTLSIPINGITFYNLSNYLVLDESSKRNLELIANSLDQSKRSTLLEVLDQTVTAMGGRLLKKWILYPLKDIKEIEKRQAVITTFLENFSLRKKIIKLLCNVYDLERLISRVCLFTATPRDLLSIKNSLENIPKIKELLLKIRALPILLDKLASELDELKDVVDLISKSIKEEPSIHIKDGGVIKKGFSKELDELLDIQHHAKSYLAKIEAREKEKTGISNLRIGFNKVFGYYIEVSKAQSRLVPDYYIRKQTLVSSERYITPELKELETKILSASEKAKTLEQSIFNQIRKSVADQVNRIQRTANALAIIDCLISLCEVADKYKYVRPEIGDFDEIEIIAGRHPVVERSLGLGKFVPNDIMLDRSNYQLLIITGPNMAGKSTILRQTALIVLMAQMGSFVPADSARIGLVDRIFTRVGATDYLSRGKSTFMVEMSETANILHNATSKSLVILDEIGRGTSTYDGLSIAWAVAEYLLKKDGGIKTMFATHYHELTKLSYENSKVKNLHVAVKEWQENIVFLHQLKEGATNKSYGIQVAALAGIPKEVINRAKEILKNIEKDELNIWGEPKLLRSKRIESKRPVQMVLPIVSDVSQQIEQKLLTLDINNITPLEALNFLAELKQMAKKDN